MIEFFRAAFAAIPSAATNGLSLAAYALVIAAWVVTIWLVMRHKRLLDKIHQLPPKDRLSALEIAVGGVRMKTGLSPEQWVRSRIHKYYLFSFFATCAVVVAIATLAVVKGASYVGTLTIINNDFRQANNGQSLSGSDLENIRTLVEAAMTRDPARARDSFSQLSAPAQAAYMRVSQSTNENLFRAEELTAAPSAAAPQAAIATQEVEPNDDILHANEVPPNATISGAISSGSDVDYFTFKTVDPRRDIIDVVLENQSTTLTPRITVFNPDKSAHSPQTNTTAGGDVAYNFVAQPASRYYVKVAPYSSDPGSYRLTIRPRQAPDKFEPNDDILQSRPITVGSTIEANVMDPEDVDYYSFESGTATRLIVLLQNRSSTLSPRITVFDPDKSAHSPQTNTTAGGDVRYAFNAQPNSQYYVRVTTYSSAGQYALTVRPE